MNYSLFSLNETECISIDYLINKNTMAKRKPSKDSEFEKKAIARQQQNLRNFFKPPTVANAVVIDLCEVDTPKTNLKASKVPVNWILRERRKKDKTHKPGFMCN